MSRRRRRNTARGAPRGAWLALGLYTFTLAALLMVLSQVGDSIAGCMGQVAAPVPSHSASGPADSEGDSPRSPQFQVRPMSEGSGEGEDRLDPKDRVAGQVVEEHDQDGDDEDVESQPDPGDL